MSTLRVTTLATQAGVEVYTAKAWVNFNGVGTVAIRGSGNVSSITDNGTGNYTVNFANPMADTNFATVMFNNADSTTDTAGAFGNQYTGGVGSRLTTSVTVSSYGAAFVDSGQFNVVVFR
jgi:hypothetical protein